MKNEKIIGNSNIVSDEEDRVAEMLRDENLAYTNLISDEVHPRNTIYTKYVKRILDICICFPLFVILLPLNITLGICTFFDVGAPIFYKQTRVGMNGKKFTLVKFRNMNNATDKNGKLLHPSQRVTKFGSIIRKLSLDELLNLWSILKGDMSIIGPRPQPVFIYERMSDRHKMRTAVRPGLECPRVIELDYHYCCKYQRTYENDIWYVENVSFFQDLKMLFLLIKMVFSFEKRGNQAKGKGMSYFVGYDSNGHAVSMNTYKESLKEKTAGEIKESKPIFLVTALGTVTASTVVKELRKNMSSYIIGADINKKYEIASSLDVDEFYTFPPVSELDIYYSFVLNFCKNHHVDYYYAVLDKEVVMLTNHRHDFEAIGTKLCIVNSEFANICHYKNVFNKWIKENIPSIYIKTYENLDEISENMFPLFIKPVEGVASSGCRKINSMEELHLYVTAESIEKEILVQDYTSGYNITVDLIRNGRTGQMAQAQRRELLRNANGCGIAVEILNDKKLNDICYLLAEKLKLNGVCNVEFFCDNGEYKIIEINPRLSAGSGYSCMAGLNTVMNALYIAQEKECILGEIAYGKHFAERYEAYQMD